MSITDLAHDLALQEAAQTEQPLHWISLDSAGQSSWRDARQLVDRVGHEDAFAFLVLSAEDHGQPDLRFAQTTGQAGRGLLVEIAQGNTVAVVAPRGIRPGKQVWITAEEPWDKTSADERVLMDCDAFLSIAFKWITAGRLDAKYEIRPVAGFELPSVIY